MKNEDKIVELLSEIVRNQDIMVSEMRSQKKEQAKTNIALGELRLSVMRLADEIKIIHEHEIRIDRLELKVFGKGK